MRKISLRTPYGCCNNFPWNSNTTHLEKVGALEKSGTIGSFFLSPAVYGVATFLFPEQILEPMGDFIHIAHTHPLGGLDTMKPEFSDN